MIDMTDATTRDGDGQPPDSLAAYTGDLAPRHGCESAQGTPTSPVDTASDQGDAGAGRTVTFSKVDLDALVGAIGPRLTNSVMNEISGRLVRRNPGRPRRDGQSAQPRERDAEGNAVPRRYPATTAKVNSGR